MMRGRRMREIYNAVTDMGGIVISTSDGVNILCALIGGTLFVIRSHAVGDKDELFDKIKTDFSNAGATCFEIDDAVTDVRQAIEDAVHYSNAHTAANLDATIDLWCEREGVMLDQRQSVALVAMLTQGGSTC